jgi:hydroxymethylglutaryl-CoA synthase
MKNIGIDSISFYTPEIFLPIKTLAKERGISYDKLNKGLGLERMSVADINEDTATFCANALIKLFIDNNLNPKEIGRIYLGTESALDSSKPTSTYAVEVLEEKLKNKFGDRSLKNCDVLDMTFACIGAVDALHNSLDWVRCGNKRKAIVIASDISKYELNSTGEYTQGAGSVALLITENPRIMVINDLWGIATKSESDFFKPRRSFKKEKLLDELINSLEIDKDRKSISKLLSNSEFWKDSNNLVEVYKEEPVFDGQYSNICYTNRMIEALDHFKSQKNTNFLMDWERIIFHLPYAFHGRRMLFKTWLNWIEENNLLCKLEDELNESKQDSKDWYKKASKSKIYRQFIINKISCGEKASTQIGNMYTASIFMSLLSMLSNSYLNNIKLDQKQIGFIAYGSGSKAKVFEGVIQKNWQSKISQIKLFKYLNSRKEISIENYEMIHKNELKKSITNLNTRLSHKETGGNDLGYRRYKLN